MRLVGGLVRIFALEIVWKLIGKILIIRLGRDFCGDSWILFGGFGVWWAVGVWESRDFLGGVSKLASKWFLGILVWCV